MKIDLPLENWVDLFGSVPREQLVQLLPQIDDRQFAKVLQFFLNKCGQITIDSLSIRKDEEGATIASRYPHKLPLADVPMPSNINNFHKITIYNFEFDYSTMLFLQQFQKNSLLSNVNLQFYRCNAEDVLAFLTNVLPMITTINSITDQGLTRTNNLLGLLVNKFPSLSKTMLTSARILKTWRHSLSIDWICRWLYTPRDDGKPRVLHHFYEPNHDNSLIDRVKKDFMEAKQPISFFLCFSTMGMGTDVQAITLENVQTHETLVINEDLDMLISRYPSGVSKQWIKEMSQYEDWEYRNIFIDGNVNYECSSCSRG